MFVFGYDGRILCVISDGEMSINILENKTPPTSHLRFQWFVYIVIYLVNSVKILPKSLAKQREIFYEKCSSTDFHSRPIYCTIIGYNIIRVKN